LQKNAKEAPGSTADDANVGLRKKLCSGRLVRQAFISSAESFGSNLEKYFA